MWWCSDNVQAGEAETGEPGAHWPANPDLFESTKRLESKTKQMYGSWGMAPRVVFQFSRECAHTHTQRSFPYISCDSKNSHIQERLVLPYMDEDMGQKGFSSFTKVTGITGNSGCDWHPGPSASKAVPVPSFATWEPGYSLKSCPKVHVGKIFPLRPLSFYQMLFALQCHSPAPVLHCQMISWQV